MLLTIQALLTKCYIGLDQYFRARLELTQVENLLLLTIQALITKCYKGQVQYLRVRQEPTQVQ